VQNSRYLLDFQPVYLGIPIKVLSVNSSYFQRFLNPCRLAILLPVLLAGPAWGIDRPVPGQYATIQVAIGAAEDGDTVVIAPGTYTESITIDKPITLRGAETARTLLRAADNNPIIRIAASGTGAGPDGVTIRGLTFINNATTSNNTAISITNSANIDIINNVFTLGADRTAVIVNDLDSTVDIVNNTFFENGTAVNRLSDQTSIRNNIFAGNTTTIEPGPNEDAITFNCFAAEEETVGEHEEEAVGDPLFVNSDATVLDFHLRENSPCIDAGDPADEDALDETEADAGAYGGEFADPRPFPVGGLTATASATSPPDIYDIELNWDANLSYLTDIYFVHYDSDRSGPPYTGNDAQSPSPIDVGNNASFTLNNLNASAATPGAPTLETISPSNQSLALRWTAIDGANAYRIYYGIADLNENQQTVGNVTEFEISGLQNGMTYRVAVAAILQPTVYIAITVRSTLLSSEQPGPKTSAFSDERAVALGDPLESVLSNELTGIPEMVEPYPLLPDQGDLDCFIATAAFGHYSTPQVQLLRDFRDNYLLPYTTGRVFVEWYYRHSPAAAAYIAEHDTLRMLTRWVLLPLIGFAYLMLQTSVMTKFLLLTFFVLIFTATAFQLMQRKLFFVHKTH
jgi:hypothetical protein